MKKIIYYVACSIDGYISGINQDISLFVQEGPGVEAYLEELASFQTVIMGRKTYEFGYSYGLKKGYPAYPNMTNYVFTNQTNITSQSKDLIVSLPNLTLINEIKKTSKTDIYLCGGGEFAGWLLKNDFIDLVKIKLNPIILGQGTSIFGQSYYSKRLSLLESKVYDDGLTVLTYNVPNKYHSE